MINAPFPSNYGYSPVTAQQQQPVVNQQPVYSQQPMMQPPAEYNAIKINIVDPKVQAPCSQPASVYSYPSNPVYSYPQGQPQQQAPGYYPMPQPATVPQPQVINNQVNNPAPPSVVPQQPATQAPAQPAPAPEQAPAAQTPAPAVPETPQPTPAVKLDVPAFAAAIRSDDLQKSGETIEKVADIAQNQPENVGQLLDTDLMQSLLEVIGKDVNTLPGATPKQTELREQYLNGKKLSDEELKIANEITPREVADRNKQYALFTTAIIQDALINEFKKTNNMTPDIKDLPGMEQIVNTIKDNPNPMLRASGLAALAYNARPEYKPVMKEIFELSKQDADENVQKVAAEGLAKLDAIMDTPAQTPAAPAQAA